MPTAQQPSAHDHLLGVLQAPEHPPPGRHEHRVRPPRPQRHLRDTLPKLAGCFETGAELDLVQPLRGRVELTAQQVDVRAGSRTKARANPRRLNFGAAARATGVAKPNAAAHSPDLRLPTV
jgi:hypothetical protein